MLGIAGLADVSDALAVRHVDHHLAHFHAALASSGFDRCLGIVMDAAGEVTSTSVYLYQEDTVSQLARRVASASASSPATTRTTPGARRMIVFRMTAAGSCRMHWR
jgi:hypothetical protein